MKKQSYPTFDPNLIKELSRQRATLRAEGFEFECDQPDTPQGRALIMSHEAALKVLGWRTQIINAVTLIDLWKKR